MGCDCHHPSLTAGMCIRTKANSGFLPQIVLYYVFSLHLCPHVFILAFMYEASAGIQSSF